MSGQQGRRKERVVTVEVELYYTGSNHDRSLVWLLRPIWSTKPLPRAAEITSFFFPSPMVFLSSMEKERKKKVPREWPCATS